MAPILDLRACDHDFRTVFSCQIGSHTRSRRRPVVLSDGSVDKIDDRPFAAIQESDELAKVWCGYVVIYRIEIAVIGNIQRIETKAHMVTFALAMIGAKEGNAKLPVDLYVQGEKGGKLLAVWRSYVVL
jgi:hypothetical protein